MSNEQKSLPLHELDTNLLFEKFTVDEIRDTEKRTRADIERKKEDLRTMVGERYRDLIEAADTITEMKNSSQNVMSTIGRMQELCTNLKESHMIKGSSLHQKKKQEMENKRKEEARFYGVASQIKLLLDMPEKIWTSLDSEDYLTASRLFLLSQHINTSLHLDAQNAPNFLYWFPVLNRQWAAISHFKSTILQGCRRLLKDANVSDQKIAESLCAILLLENSNPRQVFNEFLLARTSAVQQLFHPNSPSASTKEQICTVVKLVSTTIHQIHAVFYMPGEDGDGTCGSNSMPSNLLLNILTQVTSQKQHESGLLALHSSVSAKCLPQSVTDFCPSHKSLSLGVSTQHLQDNCQQWIQTCTKDVKSGVGKLLSFVNTVKHLATIRDTVYQLMSQDASLGLWEEVCGRVLSGPLHIWQDLLRPLFVSRVKALVDHQLELAVELSQRQVATVVMELDTLDDSSLKAEADLAGYIWSEQVTDIAPNTAWTSAGARTLLDSGGLQMKTKAYTPVIQSLSHNFDEKLKTLLEDTCFYLYADDDTELVVGDTPPFNRFADTTNLLAHIQGACTAGVDRILRFLEVELIDWKNGLSEVTTRDTAACNKLLLVARLCAALWELTPHLQKCMVGSMKLERQESLRSVKKASDRRGVKSEVNAAWETLKSKLIQCRQTAFRIWVDHVTQIVLSEFGVSARAQTSQDLVRTTARWDEVSIEEETDEGKKVTSKIYIPMQASWHLMSLLHSLCRGLNAMGGHAVARSVLQHLLYTISDGLVAIYEEILHSPGSSADAVAVNQRRALQLLFDVKFIQLIIARKDDTQDNKAYHNRVARVISRLEEVIDPFDLDVFSPYVQSNLTSLAQRSALLLGGLTSIDKTGLYGVTSRPMATTGQQEQHNVIQLSCCQNRFSLLPMASQPSRYPAPQPVIEQKLYRGGDMGGPSLAQAAGAVLPEPAQMKLASSSSFYDKIGTGLGSMTEISHWFSTIGSKT